MSKVWFRKCGIGSDKGPEGWPLETCQQDESPGMDWFETTLEGYDEYCRKMRPVFEYWQVHGQVKEVLSQPKKSDPVKVQPVVEKDDLVKSKESKPEPKGKKK